MNKAERLMYCVSLMTHAMMTENREFTHSVCSNSGTVSMTFTTTNNNHVMSCDMLLFMEL